MCMSPVSYTHLDVYKRQGFVSRYPVSLIPETSPRSKGVKAMNLVLDEIVSACISHGDASQPVSYTHLDVYKR